MSQSDLIMVNGNVYTMDPDLPRAEAVAIKNGQIIYVGKNETALALKEAGSEIVDLKGKTVIPGFIESHMHPLWFGINLLQIDCRPKIVGSMDQLLARIKSAAEITPPGKWILGWGWDDSRMTDKRYPTRWDLDQAAPDHPVFLKRTCVHMAVVNSKALEMTGISEDTPHPEAGQIMKDPATGQPTGMLLEQAMELIPVPRYAPTELEEGMVLAQKEFARLGITMVNDMSAERDGINAYQELLKKNKLTVRLRLWPLAHNDLGYKGVLQELVALGVRSGFGNQMLNIQGVKFILDGSVGGRTAAVAEPYENDPENYGILYTDENGIGPDVLLALKSGLRVSIHGIGERAIDVVLKVLERAHQEVDILPFRNRIEHCVLPTADHLARLKRLNVVVGSSCAFMYYLGDSYIKNLGAGRVKRIFPHKTYQELGLTAPGNCDCPVCDVNPLVSIYAAVTRKSVGGQALGTEQRIPVYEAIKAFTADAAYSSFDENLVGTVTAGKRADLAVLDADPFLVSPEELKDIGVAMTFMNGDIVFQS